MTESNMSNKTEWTEDDYAKAIINSSKAKYADALIKAAKSIVMEPPIPLTVTGWECPRCGKVWSPVVIGCDCKPKEKP